MCSQRRTGRERVSQTPKITHKMNSACRKRTAVASAEQKLGVRTAACIYRIYSTERLTIDLTDIHSALGSGIVLLPEDCAKNHPSRSSQPWSAVRSLRARLRRRIYRTSTITSAISTTLLQERPKHQHVHRTDQDELATFRLEAVETADCGRHRKQIVFPHLRDVFAGIAAANDPEKANDVVSLLQAVIKEDQEEIRIRMAFLAKKYADIISESKAADQANGGAKSHHATVARVGSQNCNRERPR